MARRRRTEAECWSEFCERVVELGSEVMEDRYLGYQVQHRIRCKIGHESTRAPDAILLGKTGACKECTWRSRPDAIAAWTRFRSLVEERGCTVLEPSWRGRRTGHLIRCAAGHEGLVSLKDLAGAQARRICLTCPNRSGGNHAGGRGQRSESIYAALRARVEEEGCVLIEPNYLGVGVPHRVLCKCGRLVRPRPDNLLSGCGPCRHCSGNAWDTFYAVTSARSVKLGVTSRDPRRRLKVHADNGYTQVALVLKTSRAQELERFALVTLNDAGYRPVQGCEYFDIAALPVVLDIAWGWG